VQVLSRGRTRTSERHPIRVDFVEGEALGAPRRLGMTILPGVKDPGRCERDLGSDLSRLKQHYKRTHS
jgi:hypothetical protein